MSSYFMPIPASKVRGKQLQLETQWTRDRIEENEVINQICERVARWRRDRYIGVTPTTRRLLDYWTNQERERPLFFCQIEALESRHGRVRPAGHRPIRDALERLLSTCLIHGLNEASGVRALTAPGTAPWAVVPTRRVDRVGIVSVVRAVDWRETAPSGATRGRDRPGSALAQAGAASPRTPGQQSTPVHR